MRKLKLVCIEFYVIIVGQAKRISSERQMIAKLDPAELQDRYLRLYDDHLVLKQHARKQEDKIKK